MPPRHAFLVIAIMAFGLAAGCAAPRAVRAPDDPPPPLAADIVPLTLEQERMLAE